MTKNLNELSGTELVNVMNKVMAEVKSRLDEGTVTKYVAREIPSTVDGGYNPQIPMYDESVETSPAPPMDVADVRKIVAEAHSAAVQLSKSPNQQRAELIQRAREFVEGLKNKSKCYEVPDKLSPVPWSCDAEFIVNTKNHMVTVLLRGCTSGKFYAKGIAKCMPGDVFNEWIGKAIALAKALKINIPQEFMEAVQPDEPVIGMIFKGCEGDIREIAPIGHWTQESMKSAIDSEYVEDYPIQIIDDTNAVYEGVGE